jgi:UDP-N-acetylglucosamine 3-dehydrogenase
MNASLGIAMLGCGRIARQHSRMLRSIAPEVRCYGASRFPARAADFARETHASGWFASYDEALYASHIDAVLVATPPLHHLNLTLSALAAGKHVIVEKPAFLSPADCQAVARAAVAADRMVLVAENYAYKPLAAVLQDAIGSGELGDVRFVVLNALKHRKASDWRDDTELAGGGALFEGGVHWIDLLANLGLTVESVQGYWPGSQRGDERSMAVVAQYEQGGVGVLLHSWETPSLLRGLRLSKVTGTRGSITFESNGVFALIRGRRTRLVVPSVRDIGGYRAMLCDFLRVLVRGGEPLMTLGRAEHALTLIRQAYTTSGVGAAPAINATPAMAMAAQPDWCS